MANSHTQTVLKNSRATDLWCTFTAEQQTFGATTQQSNRPLVHLHSRATDLWCTFTAEQQTFGATTQQSNRPLVHLHSPGQNNTQCMQSSGIDVMLGHIAHTLSQSLRHKEKVYENLTANSGCHHNNLCFLSHSKRCIYTQLVRVARFEQGKAGERC